MPYITKIEQEAVLPLGKTNRSSAEPDCQQNAGAEQGGEPYPLRL